MIGKSRVQEQLDKALTHAEKTQEKEINADGKRARQGTQRVPDCHATRRTVLRRCRQRQHAKNRECQPAQL